MKTAMQELIDSISYRGGTEVPDFVHNLANDLLEKEKQQIINANEYGLITDPKMHPQVKYSGKSYYENTFIKE